MIERIVLSTIAAIMIVCSLAILAGDGRVPIGEGQRKWLIHHNLSSEGVIEFQARDESQAAAVYTDLLRRDPANPYRWCDLGEALDQPGPFRQAVKLGPAIPPILVRAANFYFAKGDTAAAVPLYESTLSLVHDYDAIIFLNYSRMGLSPRQVTASALPVNAETAKNYLDFEIRTGDVSGASTVWNWALGRNLAREATAEAYIDFLLRKNRAALAAQVWANYKGKSSADYPSPNHVFNSRFEHEPSNCRLDWRLQSVEGVEASIDSHSLKLQFAGQSNVNYNGVSQAVALTPGAYALRARVKSDGLTTNKGVRFHLISSDGRALNWYSEQITGTHDWFPLQEVIAVPSSPYFTLEIVRQPSEKFDNKIQGTIWLDDVVLTEQRRKP